MTEPEEDAPQSTEGKAEMKPQPTGDINRNWVDQFYEELNQVLHKFNYFLLFTSFMFLAFVTLITNSKNNDLDWMIIVVAIVGIILSLSFFQINYHHTRVAHIVRERKQNTPVEKDDKDWETGHWILESLFDAATYFPRFHFMTRERPVSHTWFIPVGFIALWVFSLVWWCIKGI